MRKYTNAVLDAVEEGMFDKDALIADLLGWMSEDEVKEFVQRNDLMPWLEDEEEDDEDAWDEAAADFEDSLEEVDDGQPDEAQEWHDFDPDC